MLGEFTRRALLNIAIASLILVGGAFCCAQRWAQAQDDATDTRAPEGSGGAEQGKIESVQIHVRDGYRYISTYGVPHHAQGQPETLGIKPVSLAFRVPVEPEKLKRVTAWEPGLVFGVALDGVPITTQIEGLWNGNKEWPQLKSGGDQYGGFISAEGTYSYGGIPRGLISKDLSHVGYAADGFPIFVSKENKFESSYRLIEGGRASPPSGPGGNYDGRYVSDYNYVHGAGSLDRCNGLDVKGKYYIYILTPDFPYVPQCWHGKPDQTFLKMVTKPAVSRGADSVFGSQAKKKTGPRPR